MKVIRYDLNDKKTLVLVNDSHPKDFIMEAPEEAEMIADLDIDLEKKNCVINPEKVAARKQKGF